MHRLQSSDFTIHSSWNLIMCIKAFLEAYLKQMQRAKQY